MVTSDRSAGGLPPSKEPSGTAKGPGDSAPSTKETGAISYLTNALQAIREGNNAAAQSHFDNFAKSQGFGPLKW